MILWLGCVEVVGVCGGGWACVGVGVVGVCVCVKTHLCTHAYSVRNKFNMKISTQYPVKYPL